MIFSSLYIIITLGILAYSKLEDATIIGSNEPEQQSVFN